jgi:peptide/nickel transport system substrate-binding protein
VAKAKQLLAAAGAPNPRVTLMTTTVPETMRAAQVIQSMAAGAGFDIKIQVTESGAAIQASVDGQFELYLAGAAAPTLTAISTTSFRARRLLP